MWQRNLFVEDDDLFDRLCSLETLAEGFKAVKRNHGSPGIDGVTIEAFESHLDQGLRELKRELENWNYKPQPVRRVEIPKPGKSAGVRLLGIPCVRDRVVQATLKQLLEPILDPLFSNNSYGFRPGRNQTQAVQAAQRIAGSGKEYVVDIDLSKFFDRVHHDRLISRLSQFIPDKRILRIIGMTLRSGIMKDGLVTPSRQGTVQGSPLSPLLSNVVLDELDKELEHRGLEFCRFADDCNIFVGSQKAAERVMRSISKFIENKLKLVINQDKSKVALSKYAKFLGMTIIAGTIAISAQSINRAMAKVKELTPFDRQNRLHNQTLTRLLCRRTRRSTRTRYVPLMRVGNIIAAVGIIIGFIGVICLPLWNLHELPYAGDPAFPKGGGWIFFVQTGILARPGIILMIAGGAMYMLAKRYLKSTGKLQRIY